MKDATSTNPSFRKIAVASFIGTTVEWYDFFVFGQVIFTLKLGDQFFPNTGAGTRLLLSLCVFSIGFVARPLGGIVCGHLGDRVGRRSMLVSLLLIGVATFSIGCLPTYYQIGLFAPILLVVLRFAQGFGVGGEWGGAVLMAFEHAPASKRGFYGSLPQIGVPAGLFLSSAVGWLIPTFVSTQIGWVWRIPFLLSAVLVGIGLYIRLSLPESPEFEKVAGTEQTARRPVLEVLRRQWLTVLLAAGSKVMENALFYLCSVFTLAYFTKHFGFTSRAVLGAIVIASVVQLAVIPFAGILSDRTKSRRGVYLAGVLFTGFSIFPFFWLAESRSRGLMTLALVLVFGIGWSLMYGPQASFLSALFPARLRYSGASLGYQLASVIGGGVLPLIWILFANYRPIAVIMLGLCVLTGTSVILVSARAEEPADPNKNRPDQSPPRQHLSFGTVNYGEQLSANSRPVVEGPRGVLG